MIPDVLSRGGESPEEDSAWWAFYGLQQAAASDFVRHTPALRREWRGLEDKIDIERRGVESSARTAAVSGDEDEAARLLTDFMARTARDVIDRANELREWILSD